MTMPARLLYCLAIAVATASLAIAAAGAQAATRLDPDAAALARLVSARQIVLLGEVHDNDLHHALRVKALAQLVASGARPAIAFEQFDVERQPDIDRARQQRPRDADHLIAQAKGRGTWRWEAYRPMIELALAHDLPILAANLSRARAMRVANEGWSGAFDASAARSLKLDALPADFLRIHEDEIARGHCHRLPANLLPAMARAQIARDIVLAQTLRPHADRGVVLIAGNGHVRTDVGVPFWLLPEERAVAIAVGLLEQGEAEALARDSLPFDAYVVTKGVERPDPCNDVPSRPARTPQDQTDADTDAGRVGP